MFQSVGTAVLAYLCLVSGVPLESLGTGPTQIETRDDSFVVDGIDLSKLDAEGLTRFSEAEDEKLIGELDLASGNAVTDENKRVAPIVWAAGAAAVRLAPYAFRAGRLLYKTIRSRGVPKFSRGKITQNYNSRGNFLTAHRNFRRIVGNNKYERFQQGGTKGFKSQVGRHKIIVRNRSGKGGRGPPTLEIQTPNYRTGITKYRKFRFER